MVVPLLENLPPDLKGILQSDKLELVAKGIAPLPPSGLVTCWAWLIGAKDPLGTTVQQMLKNFPEKNLENMARSNDLPGWALYVVGIQLLDREAFVEAILLNERTPKEFFLEIASRCSERLATLIAENQERIIETPDLVSALEKNPKNLKSNTDKLRHFLQLSGVSLPGEGVQKIEQNDETIPLETAEEKTNEKKEALRQYIANLNVGARVKLAIKGNKEARSILVKDPNKLVALSVLKSPKITENEIVLYSNFRNVSDDVIRTISENMTWTKNYNVKLALCFHPKTSIQKTIQFIKFFNVKDLGRLSKDRMIPDPLRKASKQLLFEKMR